MWGWRVRDYGDSKLTPRCYAVGACQGACWARRRPARGIGRRAISRIDLEAYMKPIFQRVVVGVAALLCAIATFDVGRALAQSPVTLTQIEPTECGAGSRIECGYENIMHCSWRFEFSLDIRNVSGGLRIGRYECAVIGRKKLYKDIERTVTSGSCVPLRSGSTGGDGSDDFCD